MPTRPFAAALALALALGFTAPVQAQMTCGTRDSIIAQIIDRYGEVRRGFGLSGPAAIFEIWASEATGTWTILKTTPDGLSCVMVVGDGWQDDAGEAIPAGDPV